MNDLQRALLGKTLVGVEASSGEMHFETTEGKKYKLYHAQDCCESVYIESVVGDLNDLIDEPLLVVSAEEGPKPEDYKQEYEPESQTWTFYKFATRKGYVDVRWVGESNGYYSESVNFVEVE